MYLINFISFCFSRQFLLTFSSTMTLKHLKIILKCKLKLFLFVLVLSVKLTNANHHELSQTIRPSVDENTQQQAAHSVIRRLIGDKADNVAIKINFNLPGNYFKVSVFIYFVFRIGRISFE